MIIVTGATGHLRRSVVEALLRRIPATQVGVSVRDPGKAADLAALGVRVRRGGDPLARHRAAFDAARGAGADRIVYTGHMAASPTSKFPPARDHAASEAILAGTGLRWTALRHGFSGASGIVIIADGRKTGAIDAPRDPHGPVRRRVPGADGGARCPAAVSRDRARVFRRGPGC